MKETLKWDVELDSGVTATVEKAIVTVKGQKGEVARSFAHPKVQVSVGKGIISLNVAVATKREKTIVGTMYAHLNNMVKGVQHPHLYRLKICSGHFPMNVSVSGGEVIIKNFLGEVVPRKVAVVKGCEVKVDGTEIIITSPDKECAGQMASRLENACRITNRDRRIFQDGCYIIHKSGKDLL